MKKIRKSIILGIITGFCSGLFASGGGLIGKTNDFPDNRLRRATHHRQKSPRQSRKHALAGASRRQHPSPSRLSAKTSGAHRIQGNHLHRQAGQLASDSQCRIRNLLVQHGTDTRGSHGHERTDAPNERHKFHPNILGNPTRRQASRGRYTPKQSEGDGGAPTYNFQHRRGW